ncbi:Ppx/GppA phosphatase family protein [Companilactobacillus sp. DQM5]|uniref:Ppx/GppA phosphatase family protein n=1 Tax=Companilactobacillus sp. DQM5 TaxID=3463359 RepID=UPI004058C1CE
MIKKIAIIEFGSNAIRTAEFSVNSTTFKEELLERIPLRLIEDLGQEKEVSKKTIKKVINIINDFLNRINANVKLYAIATAAVRSADNKEEFIKEVQKSTNIKIEIISSDKEAYYDYLAVENKLGISDLLIADVGGGSTELIGVKNKKIIGKTSVPIGGVNITNNFFTDIPINKYEQNLAQTEIRRHLQKLDWLKDFRQPLVLLGGAGIVLFKMAQNSDFIKTDALNLQISRLQKMSKYQMNELAIIPSGTIDIINGGISIISELLRYSQPQKVTTIKASVREGYLIDKINGM